MSGSKGCILFLSRSKLGNYDVAVRNLAKMLQLC